MKTSMKSTLPRGSDLDPDALVYSSRAVSYL